METNLEDKGGAPYRYVFGPYALHSQLALPELAPLQGPVPEGLLLVSIVLGPFVANLDGMVLVDAWIAASPTEFLLTIPEVGRYLARDGCEVLIAPEASAAAIDIRLYLLGSVFGALCHQNGLLPLHASAVAHQGRVTAFLGDSGAGKSTLAAFLALRGYTVVSDDICLLNRRENPELIVIPVAGWLKLWRGSLDGLGQSPIEANRLISKDDKFRVYLTNEMSFAEQRPTLSCLVFLERPVNQEDSSPPRIERISASRTVAELMNMTYLPQLTDATGQSEALFRRCAHIASQVKAFRLIAPLGWDKMEETLDLLEREVLYLPAGA